MNIILLSGGSGKRLWPLSNDIRSKQFIQLFKDEQGEYESMAQRVYRQIKSVNSKANVTIATSKTQVPAIRNQLGDKVSVCVEPCRRDTFPAIALAAAYLHDELNLSLDECVAICPVDPYVGKDYYQAVQKLTKLVKKSKANLMLMGIAPNCPSDKYGYIIPEKEEPVSKVLSFREKPTVKVAKEYIKQGALWNAGVFACKIGYLLDRAHKLIEFTDYRDLYYKYDTLEKISFDYAVVENEPNIQVMRFQGEWRDVGTWNMMTEVMADATKGLVTMDEKCKNTNVINELDIPVLCMGLKNAIVVASSDGIFVSDKERSGAMKPFVDAIGGDVRFADKSWGTYNVIDVSEECRTVKVKLKAGEKMSYHSHNYREEVWTVVSGEGKAIVDDMEQDLRAGDVITVSIGCKHTVIAQTEMCIIEVQLGRDISKDDKTVYKLNV